MSLCDDNVLLCLVNTKQKRKIKQRCAFVNMWKPVLISQLLLFHNADALLFHKDVPRNPNSTLLDFFELEKLVIVCRHHPEHKRNVSWSFYSYKYSWTKTSDASSLSNDGRVKIVNLPRQSVLEISSLLLTDAGRYDCLRYNILWTWEISVRDEADMEYTLLSRGQTPWTDTVVNDYKVEMLWSKWTECDGCAGNGERRRFGFCRVTWSNAEVHCRSPNVPILLRPIAKSRPEEIMVDVCYDQCEDDSDMILVSNQRVALQSGSDVTLLCRDGVNIRTPLRWERDDVALRRSDVSFGYTRRKEVYLTQNNSLVLRNIIMAQGGTIRFACIENRLHKTTFELVVEAAPGYDSPNFLDQLRVVGISSAVQLTIFLIVLTIYNSARTFAEDSSTEV